MMFKELESLISNDHSKENFISVKNEFLKIQDENKDSIKD